MPSARSWNSTTETHLLHELDIHFFYSGSEWKLSKGYLKKFTNTQNESHLQKCETFVHFFWAHVSWNKLVTSRDPASFQRMWPISNTGYRKWSFYFVLFIKEIMQFQALHTPCSTLYRLAVYILFWNIFTTKMMREESNKA